MSTRNIGDDAAESVDKNSPVAGRSEVVLIVDDDPSIRMLVSKRVASKGYTVITADHAEAAREAIETQPVDMILLDVMMPGETGFELLEDLRRKFAAVSLPVIMITAKDGSEEVLEALRLGANDFIGKPIDFELLFRRMGVHLALKAGEGRLIGGYRIIRKIGAGGMGVVYAAEDVEKGGKVAIKVLPRSMTIDDAFVFRFLREARLAARIEHPNLVRVFGGGKDDETYFMVMELVDGEDLGELLDRGPLPLDQTVRISRDIANGVAAVHEAGVIHRDVKPNNIIIRYDGHAQLTDFGIARENVDVRLTETGMWLGSLIFASPEQLQGLGDERTDIYSLGCTMFKMITGNEPFDGTEAIGKVLMRKSSKPPQVRSLDKNVPKALNKLIYSMMSPRPTKRPKSFRDVVNALDKIAL